MAETEIQAQAREKVAEMDQTLRMIADARERFGKPDAFDDEEMYCLDMRAKYLALIEADEPVPWKKGPEIPEA